MKARKVLITIELESDFAQKTLKNASSDCLSYYGNINQVQVSTFQPVKKEAKKVK
jgi:predicted ABC-class ATPase